MKKKIYRVTAVCFSIISLMLIAVERLDLACAFGIVATFSTLELTDIKLNK
jgi:predicted outer membrane lipoprotein